MRKDILEKCEQIEQWIAEELPKSEIARKLGCKQETLNLYLDKLHISYAGQQNKKGQQKGSNVYRDSSYYTYKGAPTIPSSRLREKLIKDGIKQDVCEYCGNSHWLGKKLPLELHHLDGNHFNNELENLCIICPNCHAVSGLNAGAAAGSYSAE